MGESALSKLEAISAKDCQAAAVVLDYPGCFYTAVYRIRSHERKFCDTTLKSSSWYNMTPLGGASLKITDKGTRLTNELQLVTVYRNVASCKMRAKLYKADLGVSEFPRTVDDLMLRSGWTCFLFAYQLFFFTPASKTFASYLVESLLFIP